MAYQNIGTSVFYVDTLTWKAVTSGGGSISGDANGTMSFNGEQNWNANTPIFSYITPTKKNIVSYAASADTPYFNIYNENMPIDFIFLLGTNYTKDVFGSAFYVYQIYLEPEYTAELVYGTGVNLGDGTAFSSEYEGWSLLRFNDVISPDRLSLGLEVSDNIPDLMLNSIVAGKSYTMPHSPEISLTMSREMDGVKRVRTPGGVDLVDHKYTKSPPWGDAAPWELYSGTPTYQALSRSGRRTWSLSFNALMKNDMFASINSLTTFGNSEYTEADDDYPATSNTLLYSDTFYSQVIHKTNGGQLPFIFQPNKDDNTEFAICKLDMKSFKFKMVANEIFNIQIKIKEIW